MPSLQGSSAGPTESPWHGAAAFGPCAQAARKAPALPRIRCPPTEEVARSSHEAPQVPLGASQEFVDRPIGVLASWRPSAARCRDFWEVGHGILDWDGIFAAAPEGGVEWYLVDQDRCTRAPLESARLSIDYLKARGML